MKSKFNSVLLALCLLLIWVPTVALILSGCFYMPRDKDVFSMGGLLQMLPQYDLGRLWSQALTGTYIACAGVLSVLAIWWVFCQAGYKSGQLASRITGMWLWRVMLPTVSMVIVVAVGFSILMPLNSLVITAYWPWLVFIAEAALFLPLQKKMHTVL